MSDNVAFSLVLFAGFVTGVSVGVLGMIAIIWVRF